MTQRSRVAAAQVYGELSTQYGVPTIGVHVHNGVDANRVAYRSVAQAQEVVPAVLAGTSAATAANYGVFWVAPYPCTVVDAWETHATAGSAGGTVTVTVEKLATGVAPDSGVELLLAQFSLKSTANTPQEGTVVGTASGGTNDAALQVGDRLCLKDAGTLTSVAGLCVTVTVQRR